MNFRGGRGRGFNPYLARNKNTNQNNRQKPIFTVPGTSGINDIYGSDEGEVHRQPRSFQEKLVPKQSDLIISADLEPGAYYGWKLYFPLLSFNKSGDIRKKIEAFQKHIELNMELYDFVAVKTLDRFGVNLSRLGGYQQFLDDWPSFKNDIRFKSTEALACMGLAMHNVISKGNVNAENLNKKIFARPCAFNNISSLKNAKDTQNELVTVSGTIISMESIKVQCKMICYKCSECSTNVIIKHNEKSQKFTYPSKCHQGCTAKGKFLSMISSPYTIYQAKQLITIQDASCEIINAKHTLDVETVQEFCQFATIGTYLTCTGVIKFKLDKTENFHPKSKSMQTLRPCMKCFNIEERNHLPQNSTNLHHETINRQDLELVNNLKNQPSIFRTLVNSMSPEIVGREQVKAGLILALLSGCNSLGESRRSESHVLIVGNPGLGKSHLLKACAELSPIGTFVNGPTCTGVNLTGKAGKKQQMTAGVLVQSNDGICCIDEFDKMPKQHSDSLLECMEQQTVSIAKCGAQGVIPVKVSIIAAANPTLNFFNKDKTLMQNIRISKPILSRFDLIFTLTEQPQRFQNISSSNFKREPGASPFFKQPSQQLDANHFNHQNLNWLKIQPGEEFVPLSKKQLQTFIQYAKKNVSPILSPEAQIEIAKHFLQMKQECKAIRQEEKFGVTFRQLEAMLRMVTARAKADLRSVATIDDALDVINLIEISTSELSNDKPNVDDLNSPVSKRSKVTSTSSAKVSIPKQVATFYDQLYDKVEETKKNYFTHKELIELAEEVGVVRDYNIVVDKLNYNSVLLIKPGGYQFQKY